MKHHVTVTGGERLAYASDKSVNYVVIHYVKNNGKLLNDHTRFHRFGSMAPDRYAAQVLGRQLSKAHNADYRDDSH
jgi:hypothetical protein